MPPFADLCYSQRGSICLTKQCTWAYCAKCTLSSRVRHRHPVYQVSVTRPPSGITNTLTCSTCSLGESDAERCDYDAMQMHTLLCPGARADFLLPLIAIMACNYQGLWCGDCNGFCVCLNCVVKVNAGTLTLTDGLPHTKLLMQCKARNWEWYSKT